ncbi:MAG: NifB/NifX family molybdenum-iron cluster-binding protein [Prolixibacteraceae bacterium]
MKIIIPVEGISGSERRIADSFHNTEFACIYNNSNQNYEWIETKNMIKAGELGEELKAKEIGVVISRNMPLMALGFFTDSGLKVYKAENKSIEENIHLFSHHQLVQLTNAIAKSTSTCSGSCGSCSTTCNS